MNKNSWTFPKIKFYPLGSQKEWYIWFRFNGVLKIVKLGLNKIQDYNKCLKEANAMAEVLKERLEMGWIPKNSAKVSNKSINLIEAIHYGFEQKKLSVQKNTIDNFRMKTTFIVEKTNTGYSAYSEDGSVATVGDTYKELKENMLEALNMLLEEGLALATERDIVVKFDLAQFFEYYNGINILALSEKIGINNSLISQYKTGKKYPSEKQVQRIFQGIKSYGAELAQIDLT